MKDKVQHKRYTETGALGGAFIFALLAAFALFSLLIVLMGARELSSIQAASDGNYSVRTALGYLACKLRSNDETGMVSVREYDGISVLTLSGDYDGEIYDTYIYYYDGGICEYYGSENRRFDPLLGERIIDASGFECEIAGRLVSFSVTDLSGAPHSMCVYLQCGAGEGAGG